MAIAITQAPVTTGSTSGTSASQTIQIAALPAGATKLLLSVSSRDIPSNPLPADPDYKVVSALRNGRSFSLAKVADNGYRQRCELWWIDDPVADAGPPGAAIDVTFTAAVGFSMLGVLAVQGVAAGGPVAVGEDIDSAADPSVSLTVPGAALLIDACAYDTSGSPTYPGTQFPIGDVPANRARLSTYRIVTGAGTYTMQQTKAATQHAHAAAAWSAAAGATAISMKHWNGSAWVAKPAKHWNGSAWVPLTSKRLS